VADDAPLPTARRAAAEAAAAPFAGAVPSACASAVAIAQTSQVSNLAGKHRPQIAGTSAEVHATLQATLAPPVRRQL